MAQHFAHEERVAVGLVIDSVGETHSGVIEGMTGGGLHQRHYADVVEPCQFDATDVILSMQRRQGVEERVGAR